MNQPERPELIGRELPGIIDSALASDEITEALAKEDVDLTAADLRALALNQGERLAVDLAADKLLDAYFAADPGQPDSGGDRLPLYGPLRGPVLAGITAVVVIADVFGTSALWSPSWWIDLLLVLGAVLAAAIAIGIPVVLLQKDPHLHAEANRTAQAQRTARATRQDLLAQWRSTVSANGVLPHLRLVINERTTLADWSTAKITQAPGLDDVRDASMVVDTSSARRFDQAVAELRTGALGIAGARGVGKTTLLERHIAKAPAIAVLVPAPVRYDAREFVLHLYATLCRAALRRFDTRPAGANRTADRHGPVDVAPAYSGLAALVLGWLVLAFMLGHPVTSAAQLAAAVRALPATGPAVWPTAALWLAGLLLVCVPLIGRAAQWWGPADEAGIQVRETERRLARIRFLQTTTAGWSGKLTIPASELAVTGSAQQAEQPLTYPEIVAELREYLDLLASWLTGAEHVVVAIDELDKIERAEDAQVFINEIKGVFGVRRTRFVLSVSEDALAAFERRGLPVRDAFDSAFDDVVWIDALGLADSCEVLSKRVTGMSDLFRGLAHCMAGGLPRDLIRTARLMRSVVGAEPAPITAVCAALVGEDLRRKVRAFQVATGPLSGVTETPSFIRTLRGLTGDPDRLLAALPGLLAVGPSAELRALRLQAAVFAYHSATLLQVFTEDLTAQRFDANRAALDELARAKQSLATHPQLAWQQLDEFRAQWSLPVVPLPAD